MTRTIARSISLVAAFGFGAALAFTLVALPALADEPGPGGTRPLTPKTGEEAYRMVCQACHMADAKGAVGAGAFPALASNPKLATPEYPIFMVVKGRGGMPPLTDQLSAAQIADVVTYVRTHFGNRYRDPVTAADVEAMIKTR